MYTQAYFEYDSKKSYGITKSHLRFSKSPIRSTYLIKAADFLACHSQSYITRYDMIHEIKDGGTFLLNTSWTEEELTETSSSTSPATTCNFTSWTPTVWLVSWVWATTPT